MTDVHHPRPPYVGFYRKIMPGDDLKPCASTEISYEPKRFRTGVRYTPRILGHIVASPPRASLGKFDSTPCCSWTFAIIGVDPN